MTSVSLLGVVPGEDWVVCWWVEGGDSEVFLVKEVVSREKAALDGRSNFVSRLFFASCWFSLGTNLGVREKSEDWLLYVY